MRYTKEEIERKAQEAAALEVYRFTDRTKRVHTDFIEPIESLDDIDFGVDGQAEGRLFLMDGGDYNSTILANSDLSFTDIYEPNDVVCVFIHEA